MSYYWISSYIMENDSIIAPGNWYRIVKQTPGDVHALLENEAFVFYKASRYDVRGKRLLQTLDKYYLVDPEFRKVHLGKSQGVIPKAI